MIPRTSVVARRENPYWRRRRIVLGVNTTRYHLSAIPDALAEQVIEEDDPYVSVPYGRYGITTYVAGPSRGKSVMWKRGIDQALLMNYRRPAIIFDAQGVDGVLMRRSSVGGVIFEKIGEYRFGHDSIRGFTPYFLRSDRNKDDFVFKIPWTALDFSEWEYLLSQGSDAKSWVSQFKALLRANKRLISRKGLRWLYEEYDKRSQNKKYSSEVVPKHIGELETNSILRALSDIIERDYLSEDGDPYNLDVVAVMQSGIIPVINFHLEQDVPAKLYAGVMLRQIYAFYDARRKYFESLGAQPLGPIIAFEEFAQMAPKAEKPGQVLIPLERWIARVIAQGMKVRFDLHLVAQDTQDLTPSIRRKLFGQRVIMSNPTADDLRMASVKSPWLPELVEAMDMLPNDWGAFEWVVLDAGVPRTFRPGASLSMFHRR